MVNNDKASRSERQSITKRPDRPWTVGRLPAGGGLDNPKSDFHNHKQLYRVPDSQEYFYKDKLACLDTVQQNANLFCRHIDRKSRIQH